MGGGWEMAQLLGLSQEQVPPICPCFGQEADGQTQRGQWSPGGKGWPACSGPPCRQDLILKSPSICLASRQWSLNVALLLAI